MKKTITISGKVYTCEIINGKRIIDGMEVDEFMKKLSPQELYQLAMLGKTVSDLKEQGVDYIPANRILHCIQSTDLTEN